MKEKVLILLGGNILNNGIVQYCKSHDIFIVVVDWSPNAYLKGDLFLCIDVKDHNQIIEQLEAHGIHSIIGTYTSIDLAVESLNAINAHYGLKHMDNETLHHALPKALMTSIWKKNDLLNRWNDVFDEYDSSIFNFNSNKTRFQSHNRRQEVTGLIVNNSDVSIPKKYIREIRQELYYINKFGIEEHKTINNIYNKHYKDHLKGKIMFVYSVNKDWGLKLLKEYNNIFN